MDKQKMLVFECIGCKVQMLISIRTNEFRCPKCGSPIVPIRDATKRDTKKIKRVSSVDMISMGIEWMRMNKRENKPSIDVNLNMQSYYDNLVLYRSSIDAQIKVLGESSMICTHKRTTELTDGVMMCIRCHKLID